MNTAVVVNEVTISETAIANEAQHHPAATPEAAWDEAAEALIVRQVLLQEAHRRGIVPDVRTDDTGRRELAEEAVIRGLLEETVDAESPSEAECRAYFDAHQDKFRSPDLFEASHILFAAPREDAQRYETAVEAAKTAIATLSEAPDMFAQLARQLSDCSSATSGGHLGQIGRGDTVPEFETFLYNLEEGQLCPVPVKTRFGAHVLLVHRRVLGEALPYEAVRERVEAYLAERAWRAAVAKFVAGLVAAAEVRHVAQASRPASSEVA